jgi:hypothetical protein
VLKDKVAHRLTRPVGRPSQTKVKRFFEDFEYQVAYWNKGRRVIATIERHLNARLPHVGFNVTNLSMEPDWGVRIYNQRGTAEQHTKEGKYAFRLTPLSCRGFNDNKVRLQLRALAHNLAAFMCCIKFRGHGRLVVHQPPTQADQDRDACRPSPPSTWPRWPSPVRW